VTLGIEVALVPIIIEDKMLCWIVYIISISMHVFVSFNKFSLTLPLLIQLDHFNILNYKISNFI